MSKDIPQILGLKKDLEFLVEFRNRHVKMATVIEDWIDAGKLTIEKMRNQSFVDELINGLTKETLNLNTFGNKLLKAFPQALSNKKLADLFQDTVENLRRFSIYSNLINTAEFYHEMLTQKLMSILKNTCRRDLHVSVFEAYSILTFLPKIVWLQEQEEDFLKMLEALKANPDVAEFVKRSPPEAIVQKLNELPELKGLLDSHLQKYFWMQYEQEGEPLSHKYFANLLSSALKANTDARKELKEIEERRKALSVKQKELKKLLNLSAEEEYWFSVASKLLYWKLHLREVKIRLYCCADSLMQEIAKRLGLNKIQVRHMTCEELVWALEREKADLGLLNERIRYCVIHFSKGNARFLIGDEAIACAKQFVEDVALTETREVKGTCASPGYAKGVVKQVLTPNDLIKFEKGDVLVAYMTDPGVVPAMKKAAAIVTDVGGVTCHAAIVSREFGVPCVIGTKIATKAFKDGDLVEVDATNGIVRRME